KEKVAASFQPGTHGSTFGGNPLAMSAGMETIETILEGNILQEVKQKEKQLMADLIRLQQSYSRIKEIRGLGLLIGMELEGAASFIVEQLQKRNILVLTAGPNVVRILPPLTTTLDELAFFIGQLEEILLEEAGR
ncbi:MAG TPA: aminotransferase class III-fold pyridoxal phosphate-dependent enzyme, partial [Bacillota bacterium]|nr:aminotransferase class III-fold pyridoxal phosphate-dependent enzyme [Bacillota bacterium]